MQIKVNKVLRNIIRYTSSDIYMLISCLISFVTLFFSLSYMEKNWKFEDDKKNYSYKSSYNTILVNCTEIKNSIDCLKNNHCNVMLNNFDMNISSDAATMDVVGSIIINQNEKININLIDGDFPNDTIDENQCIIGRSVASYFDIGLNSHMFINGSVYCVVGIAGATSEYFDGDVYLWYDYAGNEIKKHIYDSGELEICFLSNIVDTYAEFRNAYDVIKKLDEKASFYGVESKEKETDIENFKTALLYGLLYVFSMIQCIIASELWIYERRYEITIKKMCGYSRIQLFIDLFKQMLIVSSISALICFFSFCVGVKVRVLGIDGSFSWRSMLLMLLFVFLTALINLFEPMRKIRKRSIVERINEEGGSI